MGGIGNCGVFYDIGSMGRGVLGGRFYWVFWGGGREVVSFI